MPDAYVFAGPTLTIDAIEKKFGLTAAGRTFSLQNGKTLHVLPPAAEGDVFRLVNSTPSVIGIVDGYFENIPSVWHKEILYAMARGIHVFGASSMGALRAAELNAFGMEGIGKIYKSFASRQLEDDDEVAVAHGPAELGFPPVSDAMVNIRITLDDAAGAGVISREECALLTRIAKGMFYKERTYSRVFETALRHGVSRQSIDALETWLPAHRVDQKQADAIALMKIIFEHLNRQIEKKQVLYHFEETILWKTSRTSSPSGESNVA